MASVQTRKISGSTTAATVIILDAIGVIALLQLDIIPIVLAAPLFLIPVSAYATALGINKRRHVVERDYGYHFAWSAVMLAIGVGWILLYEKAGVMMSMIAVLAIVLGYVHLNKIKHA
ncbi:MAG: hypothetical protein KGI27_09015 [Thaumarchaeota archaeon]|nr:hypothetical protein [Nitrososphaerota archaeon]